jgi:hypothetical protein
VYYTALLVSFIYASCLFLFELPYMHIYYVYVLAAEVTPGLLAGAEPDAHQFNVTICLKGDQMDESSEQYHISSETRPSMHE